jgi:hypothetical protein
VGGDQKAAGAASLKPPSGRGKAAGRPTWKDFRVLQISDSPPPFRRPRNQSECKHAATCAKFSNPASCQSGWRPRSHHAPITDSVASGRSAELGGGSGVASLRGRRQNFENGASGGDRPLSKFSTFCLGAVEAGGNPAAVAKVVLPLRGRVAGRRPGGRRRERNFENFQMGRGTMVLEVFKVVVPDMDETKFRNF